MWLRLYLLAAWCLYYELCYLFHAVVVCARLVHSAIEFRLLPF